MTEQNYRIRIKLRDVEIEAEGDKEFVEKHIEEFKKEMPKIAKELPSKEKVVVSEVAKEKVGLPEQSLGELYSQAQPQGNMETVLVFAYYLTEKEGKEQFKIADIRRCFNETQIREPGNLSRDMKTLASAKKVCLTRRGKGPGAQYTLIRPGKALIEKKLVQKDKE